MRVVLNTSHNIPMRDWITTAASRRHSEPMWTLWDHSSGQALLHVDAVTGQRYEQPHGGM